MTDSNLALAIILPLVVALLLVFLCLIFLRFRFRPANQRNPALEARLARIKNVKAEDDTREGDDDLAIGEYDEEGGRREAFGTRSFLGGCELMVHAPCPMPSSFFADPRRQGSAWIHPSTPHAVSQQVSGQKVFINLLRTMKSGRRIAWRAILRSQGAKGVITVRIFCIVCTILRRALKSKLLC
jgi:hypothetical protein